MPRIAIVIARLIVNGEDRGVRPFVVPLHGMDTMCTGIASKLLPQRAGSSPIDHAITYFDHVQLPSWALLGSLEMPADHRQNFLDVIWRVGIGSLALSAITTATIKSSAYIAGRYSMRRTITGGNGVKMPIIALRTQQLPVMHALAQAFVLEAYTKEAIDYFIDETLDPRVRHGIAATFKAVMSKHCHETLHSLGQRCGAQGLFEHNRIILYELEMRGVFIAEGDVLALAIRLASELLLSRYEMPEARDPNSLLARHEVGLFEEARQTMLKIKSSHRSDDFNRTILPLCLPLVEAIGHRMAYEAASRANVDANILELYLAGIIKMDSSWYVEHLGLNRPMQRQMEEHAVTSLLPNLETLLTALGVEGYCSTPLTDEESWDRFVDKLPTARGNATWDPNSEVSDADVLESESGELLHEVLFLSAKL